MSTLSATFQRLGGPGAVTWWAFAVSLADRLITVSVQPINLTAPLSTRVAATIVAQLVMFAPLVVLRLTLLRDPMRPRPWIALGGFALASVLRGLAFDQLLHAWGGTPLLPELRVLSGFLPTVIPLIVTAYVVNTLRERRRELAALLEVREQLERARSDAAAAVLQRNDHLVSRVRSVLEVELEALSASRPMDAVAQLQRTATDVVRPLSHELATSFSERDGRAVVAVRVRIGWRDLVGEAALDKPLLPGLTTLLLAGVWLSAAAVFPPVRWVFISTLVAMPFLLTGANAVLRWLLPRMRPGGRVVAVLGMCLILGAAVGAFFKVGAGEWPGATAVTSAATFYVTIFSAGMSIVHGVLEARTTVLEDTAAAVSALREQLLRTRRLQWFHQRALARALHGPVQSAVAAAALRLAEAEREGTLRPELVESVRRQLTRAVDVLQSPDGEVMPLDVSLNRIVGTWEGLCDVSTSADPSALEEIADDAVVRAFVTDVVTDAVTNAARHGRARFISIRIGQVEHNLIVTVVDDGSSPLGPRREGLGSTLLNECAVDWSLTASDTGHVLTVVLPGPASGASCP